MGYTLIIGRDEDLCCRLVTEQLHRLGQETVYLSESRLFPGLQFSWELWDGDSHGRLEMDGRALEFNQIDGVLARVTGIATSPADFQTKDGQYLSSEWHALIRGYVQSLPCPVVNRPGPELWYKSFLRASELIAFAANLTFQLPRTLVATSFEDARAFWDLCGRRMCYSPLTTSSNYVIDTEAGVQRLEALTGILPLCLGEVVGGERMDAYVVGQHVLFDGPSHAWARTHCQEVARSLGLTFCHFHLVRTLDDEWYCQSLDCMPNLLECGEETRNAVVRCLVEALRSDECRGPA